MEIARGNETHIEACLSIARKLAGKYFTENGIATMSEDLRKHLLYVAVDWDEVVGFVTVHRKSDRVAEISWMAVKPERQCRGIGSALIDYIASDLRSQGFKLLYVKTLSEDVKYPPYEITRLFYRKVGFIHLETIDPYPGWDPGNPCAIYVRIL